MAQGKHCKKANCSPKYSSVRSLLNMVLAWFRSIPAALSSLRDLPRVFLHRLQRIPSRLRSILKESREKNFPESNRMPIQLLLLLGGLFQMWASLLQTKLHALRRAHNRAVGKHETRWRLQLKKIKPLYFAGGAVALAVIAVFCSFYTLGTTVSYNGTDVDTVSNSLIAKRAAEKIADITAETLGDSSYAATASLVHYSPAFVRRSELSDKAELEQNLADEIGLVTYGYSLYINDELIGSTEYEGALDDLLDQLKQIYVSEDTLSVDFVEDVRIAEGYVPTESIMNLGHIAEILNSTKAGEVTYTVVKGDTWSKIANENGMTSAELEKINSGYDINRIHIGDVITISNAVPYLTVVVTERQNYVDSIDYDITYEDDNSMYQGDYRVITKGAYGSADVVADVTYINGVETDRTVLSTVTLSAPVTEHRAAGTKPRPTWMPTGTFRWPASGRITSYFGYRNTGIRGASTNHKGIDIACSYGAPIYAADGGTVTFSGYKGAMGYVVIIDHGNGYCTYYEHNSTLLVSAGAHVYKGQQIAKAGRSGVASGVHCHFGIMKNGSYVNPLKYLP